MKRAIIVIVVIIALILSYSLAYGYSIDLFSKIKSMSFEMEMSVRRAKSYFDSYDLSSATETKSEYGDSTILTFDNGEFEETLTSYFTNDKLSGFSYTNPSFFSLPEEQNERLTNPSRGTGG